MTNTTKHPIMVPNASPIVLFVVLRKLLCDIRALTSIPAIATASLTTINTAIIDITFNTEKTRTSVIDVRTLLIASEDVYKRQDFKAV